MVLAHTTSKSALSEDAVETKQRLAINSKRLQKLADTELNYPSWEREEAREAFSMASNKRFARILPKLKDKHRVYMDYQLLSRINALVSLDLDYPGYEEDRRKVMAWSRKHPVNEETDEVFQDKLQGLFNKSRLYRGDRSHPNIIELDKLHFTFPGWEKAYKRTISAHCEEPARTFADAFCRIRDHQYMHDANRSHWRLVALDTLKLAYPGFQEDIAEVENWHLNQADSPSNKGLFNEVVDGMLEQEKIYLESKVATEGEMISLNHGEEDHVDEEEDASTSSDSTMDSVATDVGRRYTSISASVKRVWKRQGKPVRAVAPEEKQKEPTHAEFSFENCVRIQFWPMCPLS
jgi:hypothetical protein